MKTIYNKEIEVAKILKDNGFYLDKDTEIPFDHLSKKQKYLWDGNNGDKWEILEKFGYPITMLKLMRNQGFGELIYIYNLETGFLYPLNNK